MRKRIVLIFLCLGTLLHGQKPDFVTVDTLSYHYFLRGEWDSLISIVNKGFEHNIESYYIHLRLGVAYYEKRQYVDAEKYLSKTWAQDPYNEYNLLILQLTKLNLGDYYNAVELYQDMSNDEKKNGVNLMKPVSSTHFTAGIKASDNKKFKSQMFFTSAGVGHSVSQKFTLYESVTYLNSKNQTWGSWQQMQFMAMGSFHGKRGRLDACVHPYSVESTVDYTNSSRQWGTRNNPYPFIDRVDSTYTTQVDIEGSSATRGIYSQLTYNQRIGGLWWSVFGGFLAEKQKPDLLYNYYYASNFRYYTPDSTLVDDLLFDERYIIDYKQKISRRKLIAGASIQYSKIWKERISLGMNIYQSFNSVNTIFSPFVKLSMNRISVYASYFYKDSGFIAERNGAILNNTADIIHNRIEIKATLKIKPGVIVDVTGQIEKRTDDFTGKRYSLNTLAGGIVIFM
jgi:tetratricopeptide (TPR) repeat protein